MIISRTKVKTGCITCRIRKVKCDEAKPACRRCADTGRRCDGYESPFRSTVFPDHAVLKPTSSMCMTVTQIGNAVELSRCFSTKTIHEGVELHSCNEEASQILAASQSDPTLQYAIVSLRALRSQYERGFKLGMAVQDYQDDELGIAQYNKALQRIASKLSSVSVYGNLRTATEAAASAVRCCQLFVSIEQARQDYRAMATHMLRGLAIMTEHHARPTIVVERDGVTVLQPAATGPEVPKLDLFLIKVFSAHCKFAEASSRMNPTSHDPPSFRDEAGDGAGDSHGSIALRAVPHRQIAPDTRAELIRLAERIAQFLSQVSLITHIQAARRMVVFKEAVLGDLHKWELSESGAKSTDTALRIHESLTPMFSDLFRLLLEIILLPILNLEPRDRRRLVSARIEFSNLAGRIMDRVQYYRDPNSETSRTAQ